MAQQRKVYVSGEYVSESDARISIFDSALMFGDMIFEMTRTYNGHPFRMRDHLERLYAGLNITEIDCGMKIDEMEDVTLETIELNRPCFSEGIDFQIMHNVSRGPLNIYKPVFPNGIQPTITINCWPLTRHLASSADSYHLGVHNVITPQRSVPSRLIDPKIKNRSRIYYQIAGQQAAKIDPTAQPLLTDEDGFITEGMGNNFFIVKNGELFTPEPRNILRGVTRQAVMELADTLSISCHERNLDPYDVAGADEAFNTSTTIAIMPVTKFNNLEIGSGKVGPIVLSLIDAFSEMVGVDIVAQANQYKEEAGAVL